MSPLAGACRQLPAPALPPDNWMSVGGGLSIVSTVCR